jgi:hypothetical protein
MILYLKDPKNSTSKLLNSSTATAMWQNTKSTYKNHQLFYTPTIYKLRKSIWK